MSAAQRNGLHWPNVCGGLAECAACRVKVDAQTAQGLSPMGRREAETLRQLVGRDGALPEGVRLACQAEPTSDIEVTKRGVRQR